MSLAHDEAWLLGRLDEALQGATAEVELSAEAGRVGTMRFAGGRTTQSGDVEDVVVQARVAHGKRVGSVRTNELSVSSLRAAIAEAGRLAEQQPEGRFCGFDDGAQPTPVVAPSVDPVLREADAGARAALLDVVLAEVAGHGLDGAGLVLTADQRLAVATSAGCRRAFRRTEARLDVIAALRGQTATDGASGRAGAICGSWAELAARAPELAADARRTAEAGKAPTTLPPGEYDVLLEPSAVAELMEWLALIGFGARAVEEGSSFLSPALQAGLVTMYDDSLSGEDGCPTLPFNAEGTVKRRLSCLESGRAGRAAADRLSTDDANALTGHAAGLVDEISDSGAVPQHLHWAAGTDDVEALETRLGRGLVVRRFHYVNGLLDTRRAVMTGMTRDGLFLVENGRRTAVRNLRWTEPLLAAFSRIDGVSRARRVVSAGLSSSVFVCPWVLIRGWHFTS